VSGPAEAGDVQLEHRDPVRIDALAESRGPMRMELDGEDASPCPGERNGQRTVTGPEVDHDVSVADG
jgi:hypothetical protein